MFLNETKPPLDEALEHFGVKGMRWGVRKSEGVYDDYDDRPRKSLVRRAAKGTLIAAGTVAAVAILGKKGFIPTSVLINAAKSTASGAAARAMDERRRSKQRDPNSWVPKRDYDFDGNQQARNGSFGPDPRGRPRPGFEIESGLSGRGPGQRGRGTPEAHVRDGVHYISTLDNDFWNQPVGFNNRRY